MKGGLLFTLFVVRCVAGEGGAAHKSEGGASFSQSYKISRRNVCQHPAPKSDAERSPETNAPQTPEIRTVSAPRPDTMYVSASPQRLLPSLRRGTSFFPCMMTCVRYRTRKTHDEDSDGALLIHGESRAIFFFILLPAILVQE